MRGGLSWKRTGATEGPGLKPGDMVGALPRAEARCYSEDKDGTEDQGFSAAGIARCYSKDRYGDSVSTSQRDGVEEWDDSVERSSLSAVMARRYSEDRYGDSVSTSQNDVVEEWKDGVGRERQKDAPMQWRCVAACVLVAAMALVSTPVYGQAATADGATFAVSTVRPSGADTGREIRFLPGGTFVAKGVNLRLLIKIAYNLNDDQVVGGPSWTGMKHFDIEAKPDPAEGTDSAGRTESELNHLRLQALLRDRFQLKLRSETKEMTTFALVVAKGGPKLKISEATDTKPHFQGQTGRMVAENATMDNLAAALQDSVGHPVLNMTGVQGRYDLKLEWTPDQAPSQQSNQPSPVYDAGPTIFTALKQQLGLSLESRKSQAQCQVLESVELPTEN